MSERLTQTGHPIIGTNIRRLRTERNMRAIDVIAKLQLKEIKVNTGIFSKVEHGLNNPTVDMLIALTEIFACDFNEFFKE